MIGLHRKWSYSSISTYQGCPLKFKYKYVDGWKTNCPNDELARKGSVFHEVAENYDGKMGYDEMMGEIAKKAKELNVNVAEYRYDSAVKRFLVFWKTFVEARLAEGFDMKRETWVKGFIHNDEFCGALDLCFEKDDRVIIIDYKTGSSPKPSEYRKQLYLYALYKGKEKRWTLEQTLERVELYLFFPMNSVGIENSDGSDWGKCLKSLPLEKGEFNAVVDYMTETVKELNGKDFDQITEKDGTVSFACKWCEYLGTVPNREGFKGCLASRMSGYSQLPTTKISKEEKKG